MSSHALILNYQDAVIYQSDLAILQSHIQWLNDACIHFFLTRLAHTVVVDKEDNCNNLTRFLDPSVVSFFMHQFDLEDDGDEDVLGLWQWHKNATAQSKRCYYAVPINDNYISRQWQKPGGGVHWSLLLLIAGYTDNSKIPCEMQYFHFDSSRGSNQTAARAVASKLQQQVAHWTNSNNSNKNPQPSPTLEECHVPQQQNGYDCGLHTLATAEALARAVVSRDQLPPTNRTQLEHVVQQSVATSPTFCANLRQRIANDIQELAAAATTTNS